MGDESRIWIGGLPDGVTEKAIKDEYDKFGTIKHVQIRCNRGSPAFAFVQYTDRRDAEDAVRSTDQQKLFGMPFVKVSWAGKSAPKGGGKGKGKGKRSRTPRRSRSRSPSRRDSRRRSPSPPPRKHSRSRSPPRRKDSPDRSPPRNGDRGYDNRDRDRRSPSRGYDNQGRRGSRSRDGRGEPPRGRSGSGGRGRSGSGERRPAWFQPKPSEVQGKYRMKIERLPEDMGWQELKGLGTKFAKVGQCTFSRTNRDRTGVLEFTAREDMDRAISELDGRRFSGADERVKAYEERGGGDDRRR